MPGIFGIKLRQPCQDIPARADLLGRDLCRYPWQRSQVIEGDSGQVYLGAAWNDCETAARGGDLCSEAGIDCVLEGRIVRVREECGAGPAVTSGRHARAAILAYRRFGDTFASRLEGPFSLILYDRARDIMLAATERHGLIPLYRHDGAGAAFFCSMLGPMVGSGVVDATIDPASAATFLGHHHLFFQQSLFEGIVLQDPATIAIADGDQPCELTRYWHYGDIGPRGDVPYRRRLDDLCDTLLEANERVLGHAGRLYTSLSGGVDSRLVTGLALRAGARPKAWTFGAEGSTDLAVAAEICRRHELEHLVYRPDPAKTLDHLEAFVTLVNGCGPVASAFALARGHDMWGHADVILNGYRGGVLLGDAIIDLGFPYRLRRLRARLSGGPPMVSAAMEDATSDDDMAAYYLALSHQAHPGVAAWTRVPEPPLVDMFRAAVAGPLAPVDLEYRLEQWTEEFGGGRHYTLLGIVADRHFYADASHFYDYDVRDRCFALAPADRRGRKAYIDVLKRLVPDLARLPYANTGLPADTPPWRVLATKAARRLAGRRMALSTGTQPNQWINEPQVRDFCGDILHSQRSRDRSWWHGDAVAEAFDQQMAGRLDMAAELWNAVALELFARRWLDQRQATAAGKSA
jgi:hypothetical protein